MKTYEKYLNEKKKQRWTFIKTWYIDAQSNTEAVEKTKNIRHDEV